MAPKANKIEQEIKKLSKIDGNKTCADCPEKVPGYVDLTHNVFICTKCSGIHREFQFKIKGVSMSIFSEEDVAGLASMGNEKFNSIYLARLSNREVAVNHNDTNKLKEFIRQKYVDKKWHRTLGTVAVASLDQHTANNTTIDTPTEGSSSNQDQGKIKINFNRQSSATGNRRASTGPGIVGLDQKKPSTNNVNSLAGDLDLLSVNDNKPQSQNNNSFDPFGATTTTSNTTTSNGNDIFGVSSHDPFASTSSSNAFDAFGSNNHANNHNNHGFSATNDGFDAFGSSATPNSFAAFDQGAFATTNNSHSNAFGAPTSTPVAPMPFIQTKPVAPVAPVATTTTTTTPSNTTATSTAPPAKNFSAFDELMSLSSAPPTVGSSNNPFDGPVGNSNPQAQPTAQHFGHPPANVNAGNPFAPTTNPPVPPANTQMGAYPVHQPPQPAYGYGYPPHQPQPQGYGAYPPQQPPAYPGYGAPVAPGYPPQNYYGQPPAQPQPAPRPPQMQAQAAQPTPQVTTPDPFASMSAVAWNAVGGSAPSSSNTANRNPPSTTYPPAQPPANNNPYNYAPQPVAQPQTAFPPASHNPYAQPNPYGQQHPPAQAQIQHQQPAQPPSSVNPFDLF